MKYAHGIAIWIGCGVIALAQAPMGRLAPPGEAICGYAGSYFAIETSQVREGLAVQPRRGGDCLATGAAAISVVDLPRGTPVDELQVDMVEFVQRCGKVGAESHGVAAGVEFTVSVSGRAGDAWEAFVPVTGLALAADANSRPFRLVAPAVNDLLPRGVERRIPCGCACADVLGASGEQQGNGENDALHTFKVFPAQGGVKGGCKCR